MQWYVEIILVIATKIRGWISNLPTLVFQAAAADASECSSSPCVWINSLRRILSQRKSTGDGEIYSKTCLIFHDVKLTTLSPVDAVASIDPQWITGEVLCVVLCKRAGGQRTSVLRYALALCGICTCTYIDILYIQPIEINHSFIQSPGEGAWDRDQRYPRNDANIFKRNPYSAFAKASILRKLCQREPLVCKQHALWQNPGAAPGWPGNESVLYTPNYN